MSKTNGRDCNGRFAKGNPGGPGNPYVARVAALRTAMLDAVSQDDLRRIVIALVKKAEAGDVMAAREVLDRCVGKPTAAIELDVNLDDDSLPEPNGGPTILEIRQMLLNEPDFIEFLRQRAREEPDFPGYCQQHFAGLDGKS